MSERRAQRPDRRVLLPRPGGRRETDPPPEHGTRARYQHGCRCLLCRAAEAMYRAALRRLHAAGRPPLGARISPIEARKRLAQMKAEKISGRAVNRLSGLKSHALVVHSAITVRKLLRIRRIYRFYMTGEGPDQPSHATDG